MSGIRFLVLPRAQNATRTFCPSIAQPDQVFGHGSRLVQAGRDTKPVTPDRQKSLFFRGLDGGRCWDRTSDPYDVKVVLFPAPQAVSVSTSTLWERVLKAVTSSSRVPCPAISPTKKPRDDIGLAAES